ncbi:MAG: NADPH:quinone oxidoreductase family protein [Rhodobacteraceae bacterium]|jgi:NADPH2:quinone reductase|nr:NADPH:quinone oxidoreductase family protein [Paracoccaceae bacterium]
MRAFQLTSYAQPPELAEIGEVRPAAGQVRVAVAAAALNFADLLRIEGRYQEREDPPLTLGMEFAGTITELGAGVAGPPPGTRVMAFAGAGALAEAAVVPAAACVPIPDTMPWDDAAAFPVAYGTSHLALTRRARLAPGETLAVLGAGGGVGLTAVELGAHLGARVIAFTRGADKAAAARAAGAAAVHDPDHDDVTAVLRDAGGADVIYDTVGGTLTSAALRATRPEARLLLIGFAAGTVPDLRANHLLVKNVDAIGVYWGGYLRFAPQMLADSLSTCLTLYTRGALRPHISHRLPLARAAEGLDLLRTRVATGKVVVTIPD